MKTSSVVLACLLMAASCSKVKELDKRTESMESSTTKMSETTSEMEDKLETTLVLLRSGDSAGRRLQVFDHMTNENTDFKNKIADACIYFKAFEYQLLTDEELRYDQHIKSLLLDDAVNEFTKRLGGIQDQIKVNKLNPTDEDLDNEEQVYYAFALALHMNHHYQEIMVSRNSDLHLTSMNDLIKGALLKGSQKKSLESHEDILLNGENREIIIDLLKARVDILSALALKNLTNKKAMTLKQKAKGLLFLVSSGHLGNIDLPETYDKATDSTKEWTEKYLDSALKTKKFLHEIGVDKKLEKTLRAGLKEIDLNEKNSEQKKDETVSEKQRKVTIKNLINELVE
ncbi:hypothetical protein ACJVC5_00545 [Peredibacter sp. HCB2-198]|uniref:hypothetical protein n=1 Tax=Peredibacter sp. HCB2-198 TaxID=3383025 RepID=UPI0038B5CD5F